MPEAKSAKHVFAPDVPGIHALAASEQEGVDGRNKSGHDGEIKFYGCGPS